MQLKMTSTLVLAALTVFSGATFAQAKAPERIEVAVIPADVTLRLAELAAEAEALAERTEATLN